MYNSNEGFYTDPEQEVEHADLEGPELSHYAVPPSPSPPPSAPSLDPPYTRLCLMNVCRDSPTFSAPDKLVTSSSNNKCNESRPYLKCSNPGCRAFIGWLDQRGIHENNPHCLCGIPSRKLVKVKSRREPELFRIWFNCANSNLDCGFREDAPKVEGSSRIDFIDLILNHDDICRMKTDGEI